MYPQCLHYRTTSQLEKKFPDENSVTEAKQLLGNLVYHKKTWKLGIIQKKDLLIVDVGAHRVKKITPP